MTLSRRFVLAGALASVSGAALASPPLTSIRPRVRQIGPSDAANLIAQSNLSGQHAFALVDLNSGETLDSVLGDLPQPPASVTKAFTALYALDALGPGHRFTTQVIATGPVIDGVLEGDLILAGGGDPNLVTDQLADLAQAVKDAGLREVRGDFLVWDDALANLEEIDPAQLDHLGYNPTITGLNLNFNRVHFEWRRAGNGYTTALDARSDKYRPTVTSARMQIVDRAVPVFTYRDAGGIDEWTVARGALNNGGSRWLPVRNPGRYAGEVFAGFARSQGIVLAPPVITDQNPQGNVVAQVQSASMEALMRSMMRFSTNITAEVAGLAATTALTGQARGLRTSALGMTRWAAGRAGISPDFVDHSGLGDAARVTVSDMVTFLRADGVAPVLRPLMKRIEALDRNGNALNVQGGGIMAKTGTLNFVSCLAGYVQAASGRQMAFAYFGSDLAAREQAKARGDENPAGARGWNRRSRALQQTLLRDWIKWG